MSARALKTCEYPQVHETFDRVIAIVMAHYCGEPGDPVETLSRLALELQEHGLILGGGKETLVHVPLSPLKEFENALRTAMRCLSSSYYELHGFSASILASSTFMVDVVIVSYPPHEIRNPMGAPDLIGRLREAGLVITGTGPMTMEELTWGSSPVTIINSAVFVFSREVHEEWLAKQAELPIVRKGSLWTHSGMPDSIETELFTKTRRS